LHKAPTIIFDLDSTLYNTPLLKEKVAKYFEAEVARNPKLQGKIKGEELLSKNPDDVVSEFRFNEMEKNKYLRFYENLPLPQESLLFPDVRDTLIEFKQQGNLLFLVTRGEAVLQWRKIRKSGISHFFKEVIVVGARCKMKTKHQAFEDIVIRNHLLPSSAWIIGDGQEELTAGRELGCQTVQTLRPGIPKREADHHITILPELLTLI
jgi:FMN phosphatase YigB (HAD superfamily)